MRECGECNLCCTLLKVRMQPVLDELKPERQTCQFLCGNCSIYDNKPEACGHFSCVWLVVNMPEHLRPDRCGVVLEFNNLNSITAHAVEDNLSSDMKAVFQRFIGTGLDMLLLLPGDECFKITAAGERLPLINLGLHPINHNVVYIEKEKYDAMPDRLKESLKKPEFLNYVLTSAQGSEALS